MALKSHPLLEFHRFLVHHAFYALLLSSMLACSILVVRIHLSGSLAFIHLTWDLFLAWIPYLCSLGIAWLVEYVPGSRWAVIALALLWLSFFPNAPYLLTEFIHLPVAVPLALWYDIGLIIAFAWTGCFLAVVSLRTLQHLIRGTIGTFGSWIFVCVISGLSGLGVYLGRILRWNSWDIVANPRNLLGDVLERVLNPRSYPQTVGMTLMFTALLLMSYLTLTAIYDGPMQRDKT